MGLLIGGGNTQPQYPYSQWYGVKGNFTSSDKILTRVGSLDLHRTLPLQSKVRRFVENTDGSVKYYLHQNDSRKKDSGAPAIIDSTDGNVMLELPEHYFRFEVQGTEWIFAISEYPLPGFVKIPRRTMSPWYATVDNQTNTVVSGCFLTWNGDEIARDGNNLPIFADNASRFRGGANNAGRDGAVNSDLGMPRTSISRTTMRNYCKNGTHVGSFAPYNTLKWFMRIEYANMDCQAAFNATLTADGFHQGGLGDGTYFNGDEWNAHNGYYPFIPSGVTATLGNNSGIVEYVLQKASGTKTFRVQSYRGCEVPYQYLWLNCDDVLVHHHGLESYVYWCNDPTKFATPSEQQANVPEGYVVKTKLPEGEGYVLHEATDSINQVSFPDALGGSSNAGICDYFWRPGDTAEGWYAALFACSANFGAYAGFGGLYTYYRPANTSAHFGFRLCRN